MPAVSPSMTEGTLARWLKNEGEAVKAGEAIAEIETDKALVDLEAEHDGTLGRILVADGTAGIQVGSVIAMIVQPGESLGAMPAASTSGTATGASPSSNNSLASPPAAVRQADFRAFASPLAKRLARAHDLDLTLIQGSGPNGRVVKRDIDLALKAELPASGKASTGARDAAQPIVAASPPASSSPDEYVEIPHSGMRRIIAQRLSESKQQVPHFYLTIDCRLDKLLSLRQEINNSLEGTRVSVNDFIVKAVAAAIARVPAVNASWTDTAVRRHKRIDVSVAVATPVGLITPVVRGADAKSLRAISDELKDLAERARKSKLLPHEYQGGGISISNLGMYGIREFAAIINPPQSCILAVGAGEPRAVVVDGAVTTATVMTCTLSVDHRVVDGALGAEFLAAFKAFVENPIAVLV